MLKNLKLKDYATLVGTFCGFIAIYLAISPLRAYRGAILMVFVGVVADLFDGYIARKTKQFNDFGIQLDSLSDAIVFGVAPAIVIFMNYTEPNGFVIESTYNIWFLLIPCFLLVAAGIVRLAWFNVQEDSEVYRGMPIPNTATGLFLIILSDYFAYLLFDGITLYNQIIHWGMPIIVLFMAWTNVTDHIQYGKVYRKKSGFLKWIYLILAINFLILPILIIIDRVKFAPIVFIAVFGFMGLYTWFLVVGFRTAHEKRKKE
ncbi:MAG: CDP-alcohol phosphatidyltransferase family protein [Promethearchaeota archaeon]